MCEKGHWLRCWMWGPVQKLVSPRMRQIVGIRVQEDRRGFSENLELRQGRLYNSAAWQSLYSIKSDPTKTESTCYQGRCEQDHYRNCGVKAWYKQTIAGSVRAKTTHGFEEEIVSLKNSVSVYKMLLLPHSTSSKCVLNLLTALTGKAMLYFTTWWKVTARTLVGKKLTTGSW